MKIAIICESELLQKSLESYLVGYIAPLEQCDFVLSDYQACDMKPVCLVGSMQGARIKTPFTQESLLANCRIFYAAYCEDAKALGARESKIFAQVDMLIQETLLDFRQKLYTILRNENG